MLSSRVLPILHRHMCIIIIMIQTCCMQAPTYVAASQYGIPGTLRVIIRVPALLLLLVVIHLFFHIQIVAKRM